jgi:purine nucleosidase/pyrimidine-specific ribonucleoside hydrolase
MIADPAGRRGGGCPEVPILLDTDPGIDDALALLLALRMPGWRVEAITTVAGNVPVSVGTRNVARVLGAARPDPVPRVAPGAARPRAGAPVWATHVHGDDGLGGLGAAVDARGRPSFPEAPLAAPATSAASTSPAAALIAECARRWPGVLRILALGPLTNLADALDAEPEALRRVASVVWMGGAVVAPGNVTAAAEFNAHADPESAARVLAAGLPLTMVPLDVTLEVRWAPDVLARWPAGGDGATRLARALAERALGLAAERGAPVFALHDPLAVAVARDPSLVRAERLHVAIEIGGALTRGMTVTDRRSRPAAPPNCDVALRIDAGRALAFIEETLWARSP